MSDYEKRTIKSPTRPPLTEVITLKPKLGGTKHDQDKPRLELVPPKALIEVAKVLTVGAAKYEDHNWARGFKWSRLYGASLRHILAHMGGEDLDQETGLSHIAHAICGLMFLLEHEVDKLGQDDRRKS